ncbi:hypothetical protein Pmani_039884 [Petrolisthes manimaculis]|uniref:Uncharacterized protein n=1 Tax=Petrolisthes manimaculis TaxID=1843537 RepID=A0AAE1ND74_9EUCA|nr:hypothetical protein Pmani_039884 [Petrolisthes manimaculis]
MEVMAVEGGLALLPCDVSATTPGDYPILVLFYSGVTGLPIYSIDGRAGFRDPASHYSALGKRASFARGRWGVEGAGGGGVGVHSPPGLPAHGPLHLGLRDVSVSCGLRQFTH